MASRTAHDPQGRARPAGRMPSPTRRPSTPKRSRAAHYVPILLFVLGYLVVTALWPIPIWVAGIYLVASIVCFVVYAVDKSAAGAARRRVSERTRLTLGFVGGWPGAIIAQQTLRHKTQKASFRKAFWGTVMVNLAAFALFATPAFALLTEWVTRR